MVMYFRLYIHIYIFSYIHIFQPPRARGAACFQAKPHTALKSCDLDHPISFLLQPFPRPRCSSLLPEEAAEGRERESLPPEQASFAAAFPAAAAVFAAAFAGAAALVLKEGRVGFGGGEQRRQRNQDRDEQGRLQRRRRAGYY